MNKIEQILDNHELRSAFNSKQWSAYGGTYIY